MSEKVIFPIYGCQSLSSILEHIKDLTMSFDARVALAEELRKKFKEVRFKVIFDIHTGKIESVTQLED
jgi:hypothetical protein